MVRGYQRLAKALPVRAIRKVAERTGEEAAGCASACGRGLVECELVQQVRCLGYAIDAEDEDPLRRARLDAAVGVVDVDSALAELYRGAPERAGPVRHARVGDVRLFKNHAHAAEHGAGGVGVIRDETHQALALFHVGLESEDVDAALGERPEAAAQ